MLFMLVFLGVFVFFPAAHLYHGNFRFHMMDTITQKIVCIIYLTY